MHLLPISEGELPLLALLVSRLGAGADFFRYFDKRPFEVVLAHEVALLLVESEEPIAYGHLEREGSTVWLGVAVCEEWVGKGLGKKMVTTLLESAREHDIPVVYLTVDKTNQAAINLYENVGFVIDSEGPHYWKYRYQVK